MSKGAVNFNETAVEWYTPKSTVDMFGVFDYDPATTEEQAEYLDIPNYDTIKTDGLLADWTQYKRIWINPPFNHKHLYWRKACETYTKAHNDIYFLCPIAFLTTSRFHQAIEQCGIGVKIFIPNGRIKFISTDKGKGKSPAFGCVIVKPSIGNEVERIKL